MAKKNKKSQDTENQSSVNQHNPRRFQVQFDIEYGGTTINKHGKSQTVPDMNLTVRQLLTNHSRGLSNDRHTKDPLYFDVQIPKITDITDVEAYRESLQYKMDEVNKFIEDEIKEKDSKKIPEQNFKKPGEQLDIEDEAKNNPTT